jgi:hypothetical protein
MSVTAVVRHKVADYDAWRSVYDTLNAGASREPTQPPAGKPTGWGLVQALGD